MFVTVTNVTNLQMHDSKVYGWEMGRVSESYLTILSDLMTPHGLDRFFVPFLHIHANNGKLTQKDLATALKRDKVSIMRIVDHLSEKGLVVRKADASDRRCQLLETTEKAIGIVPLIKEAIVKTNDILLESFTDSERKQFADCMTKIMNRVDTLPESEYIIEAVKREKN